MKEQVSGSGSKGEGGPKTNNLDKRPEEGRTRPIAGVDSSIRNSSEETNKQVRGVVVVEANRTEDFIVKVLPERRRSQELSSIDEIIMKNLCGEANKTIEELVIPVDEPDESSFDDGIDEVKNIPEQSQEVETAPMGSGLVGSDIEYQDTLDKFATFEQLEVSSILLVSDDTENIDQNSVGVVDVIDVVDVSERQGLTSDSVSAFLANIQGSPMVKKGRVCQISRTNKFNKITKAVRNTYELAVNLSKDPVIFKTSNIPYDIFTDKSLNIIDGQDFIFNDETFKEFPDVLIARGALDLSRVSNNILIKAIVYDDPSLLAEIRVNRLILSSYVDDRVLRKCREYERGENILGQIEFSDHGEDIHGNEGENFAGLFDNED